MTYALLHEHHDKADSEHCHYIMTTMYAGMHVYHYKRAEAVKHGEYIQAFSDNGTAVMYQVTSMEPLGLCSQ